MRLIAKEGDISVAVASSILSALRLKRAQRNERNAPSKVSRTISRSESLSRIFFPHKRTRLAEGKGRAEIVPAENMPADVVKAAESARLVNDTAISDCEVRSLFKTARMLETGDSKRRLLACGHHVYFEFMRDIDGDVGTLYVSNDRTLVGPLEQSRKLDVGDIVTVMPLCRDVHHVANNVYILRANDREWMVALRFPAYKSFRALKAARKQNYPTYMESADISPLTGTDFFHCLEWKGVNLETLKDIVVRTLRALDEPDTAPFTAPPKLFSTPPKLVSIPDEADSACELPDLLSGVSIHAQEEASSPVEMRRPATTTSTVVDRCSQHLRRTANIASVADNGRLSQFVFPDVSLDFAELMSTLEQTKVDLPSVSPKPKTSVRKSARFSLAPVDFSGMTSISEEC
ncbi:MAG: uncharacterized protein KVP18_005246 [Porospora cf. gigantea A]|uniref:uncharacterized protein n=1 Tax=Porospora cf. gigantea A TaxID=2853593 RepID=UPI00355938F6|nr:MAG: hypothetical protein KVP18_005246 [Porospora cf. gigantea A]